MIEFLKVLAAKVDELESRMPGPQVSKTEAPHRTMQDALAAMVSSSASDSEVEAAIKAQVEEQKKLDDDEFEKLQADLENLGKS